MPPIQKLRALLESHGIYQETVRLMRQVVESVNRFEEGHYYRTVFQNGESIYLLVGRALRNGGNMAIKIEDYRPIAASTTTTNLTPGQWNEIGEQDVPPKLLTKLHRKMEALSQTRGPVAGP